LFQLLVSTTRLSTPGHPKRMGLAIIVHQYLSVISGRDIPDYATGS
jgi:hypothetical protein